jgi:hypothetical protein
MVPESSASMDDEGIPGLAHVTIEINALFDGIRSRIEAMLPEWLAVRDPAVFRALELAVATEGRALADGITGAVLKKIVTDSKLQAAASVAAQRGTTADGRSLRSGGRRTCVVDLLGGGSAEVQVEYLQPNHRKQPKRRAKRKGRGKGGSGVFPVLAVLGIHFGVTPAVACEVCRQVADSDSVRAGREALARRGLVLSQGRTLRIVNQFSHRAVDQRSHWMEAVRQGSAQSGPLHEKRVVVATDGGRLRQRVPPKGGRRRANGHQRYDAPWVEPKLLVIYVIDDKGRIEHEFCPVYDGTQEDCNGIFNMLEAYLKALGIHEAGALIILGDGAKWIWERAAKLAANVGLPPERLIEVVDKCHAVGTLHEIADVRKGWTVADREKWLKRALRLLGAGSTEALVAHIHTLAVGRNAKDVSSHEDYFRRNGKRMQYQSFLAACVPIGSGAVESAVRRVINMRMKSNAMFWLEINAEGMLLLRSYLKAGRFDDLIDWSHRAAAPWWQPTSLHPLGPLAAGVLAANDNSIVNAAADLRAVA